MIFETTVNSPVGKLRLFATDAGLRAVLWPRQDHEQRRGEPEPVERANHPVLAPAAKQLEEYFAHRRRVFDVPLDPLGTPVSAPSLVATA